VEIGKKTVAEKERTEGDVPLRATIYLSGEKKKRGGGGGGGKKCFFYFYYEVDKDFDKKRVGRSGGGWKEVGV
jgi:hypothetical protein